MKKKTYQAPAVKVFILKQRQSLLAGSLEAKGLSGHGGWGGMSDTDDEAD